MLSGKGKGGGTNVAANTQVGKQNNQSLVDQSQIKRSMPKLYRLKHQLSNLLVMLGKISVNESRHTHVGNTITRLGMGTPLTYRNMERLFKNNNIRKVQRIMPKGSKTYGKGSKKIMKTKKIKKSKKKKSTY